MKLWKVLMLSTTMLLFAGMIAAQEHTAEEAQDASGGGKELAAAIAIAGAAIGAGYAVGVAGSAAAGAVAEKAEVFSKVLIFVAFAEALAIYGLLVALIILFT